MSFKLKSFKFAIVGSVTAFIYYVVLYTLIEYLSVSILLSSSLAYILAIIFNYSMHYQWTFSSDNPHKVAVPRFIFMNAGGFFINLIMMAYCTNTFPDYYLLIQTFTIGIIVVWNFMISSLWVFNNKQTKLLNRENNNE